MVYSEYNVNKMLFTYQKSCEKLAKGEFMKIGLVKNTHTQFRKEREVSVCSEMIGLAAALPSTGIWHASPTISFHTVL